MLNRCYVVAFFVIVSVVIGAHPALATDRLVTGDDYAPFTGRSLPNQGLASDIVSRVFDLMRRPVELEFKPWKRGYADTLDGIYLGTFPYGRNPDREKLFHYSEPLYRFGQYFFTLADSDIDYQNESDLQGRRVCLPQGYNPTVLGKYNENGTITLVRPIRS